jgi:peptidase E
MATFILHGGYTSAPVQSNRDFFHKITKDLSDGASVLVCYFAREQKEYDRLFAEDQRNLIDNARGKEINVVLASVEHFVDQLSQAGALYMRGGSTQKLLSVLKRYPAFSKLIAGKVVAGSSAGAYVLAKYFYSQDERAVGRGLGLLPIGVIAHFDNNQEELDQLKQAAKGLEVVTIPDSEFKVFSKET